MSVDNPNDEPLNYHAICRFTFSNPFKLNGILLDQSIFVLRVAAWIVFFKFCKQSMEPCSVASDLRLHHLPMSHKKDTKFIWIYLEFRKIPLLFTK